VRVTREHILKPMAQWLGGADGMERAANILMMTLGLSIFGRELRGGGAGATNASISNRLFAHSLQALVNGEGSSG
jgi:hypothetical protein